MIDVLNRQTLERDKAAIQDLPDIVKAGEQRAPTELMRAGWLEFLARQVDRNACAYDVLDRPVFTISDFFQPQSDPSHEAGDESQCQ